MTDSIDIIEKALIIYHQLPDETCECIISGPDNWERNHYCLIVADIIGHLANHFGCDAQDLWSRIQEEIDNPTTELRRTILH